MKNFVNNDKINTIILSSTFIFFITINLIYFYIHLTSNNYGIYSFNELFINYQAGFIRRGLLGEIAWQLNENFLINPNIFFSVFFMLIHLTQFLIFFYLFKKIYFFKNLIYFNFLFSKLAFISYLQSRFVFFKR